MITSFLFSLKLYYIFLLNVFVKYLGPVMVMVQKLSALACGLHDGLMADKKQLTELQKRYMIRLNIFYIFVI